jgi:prevent-host-death family protein
MGILSIREFNANVSRAIARVEAGETIEITRNGKVAAQLAPKRLGRSDDPKWRGDLERLGKLLDEGVALGGAATYDERTG